MDRLAARRQIRDRLHRIAGDELGDSAWRRIGRTVSPVPTIPDPAAAFLDAITYLRPRPRRDLSFLPLRADLAVSVARRHVLEVLRIHGHVGIDVVVVMRDEFVVPGGMHVADHALNSGTTGIRIPPKPLGKNLRAIHIDPFVRDQRDNGVGAQAAVEERLRMAVGAGSRCRHAHRDDERKDAGDGEGGSHDAWFGVTGC